MPAENRRGSILMLTADRQIDRRILLEAESLREADWDVVVLAMPAEKGGGADPVWVHRLDSQSQVSSKEHIILAAYRMIRQCLPMNGRLMSALKRIAWRYFVDQESFYTAFFIPAAYAYSPTVVVAHDLPMLPSASLVAQYCGAKLVYDSHELYCEQELSRRERARWRTVEQTLIGDCERVITVNQALAAELKNAYGLNHVSVVQNASLRRAVMTKARYFHQYYRLTEASKVLLYQGGVIAGRNLDVLVEAMEFVSASDVHLVILGDGILTARLQSIIRRRSLCGRVHLHAAVSQQDLPELTASADAGVIPYLANCLNNLYCTPNKLFEFIAAGVPVLASDLPEVARVIYRHSMGQVADFRSSESIARAIHQFFVEPDRLQQWRQNAAAASQEVCWELEGRKIVALYESLI